MEATNTESLEWLFDEHESADELLVDHKMDISASVFKRMEELGISKSGLAKRMGVDNAVVTRIISGKQNITLKTIAKLEEALNFKLDSGFKYYELSAHVGMATMTSPYVNDHPKNAQGIAAKLDQRSITRCYSFPNGELVAA
ncbi:MAG: helix-turn-helix transcriptional regulator [Atopobiaceae bacterium]|jgi:transcriptional regulator with XRE-family HTH domain|nr:helix-turn-helix transcriptional regulator [Atopobiaceae bacterium]